MIGLRSIFTRGQTGNATVPELHETRTAPAVQAEVDYGGTGYAGAADPVVVGGLRGFRARQLGVQSQYPTNQPGTATVDPDVMADVHAGHGAPDARHTGQQPAGHSTGEDGYENAPEVYSNDLRQTAREPKAPPARARQGFTGEDPSRTTTYRRPQVLRAFDKGIAEHAGGVDKIAMPAPLARTSRIFGAVNDPRPYAGGYGSTEKAGVGPQKQTFRVVPPSWGENLVANAGPGDPAQAAASRQARRGFRA